MTNGEGVSRCGCCAWEYKSLLPLSPSLWVHLYLYSCDTVHSVISRFLKVPRWNYESETVAHEKVVLPRQREKACFHSCVSFLSLLTLSGRAHQIVPLIVSIKSNGTCVSVSVT